VFRAKRSWAFGTPVAVPTLALVPWEVVLDEELEELAPVLLRISPATTSGIVIATSRMLTVAVLMK